MMRLVNIIQTKKKKENNCKSWYKYEIRIISHRRSTMKKTLLYSEDFRFLKSHLSYLSDLYMLLKFY